MSGPVRGVPFDIGTCCCTGISIVVEGRGQNKIEIIGWSIFKIRILVPNAIEERRT